LWSNMIVFYTVMEKPVICLISILHNRDDGKFGK